MRRSVRIFAYLLLIALLAATNVAAGKPYSPKPPRSAEPVLSAPNPGPVEVLDRRTRTSKHFLNPDGTYTAELSTGSVHYQDTQGKWQDIDNRVVPTAVSGYAYRNAANGYQVQFTGPNDGSAFLMRAGDRSLRFSPVTAKPAPGVVDGSSITYPSAFVDSSADLRYIVGNDTVEAAVVLHNPEGGGLSFLLEPKGLTPRLKSTGHVELADPNSGETVWMITKPFVMDNNGEFTADASYTLTQQGSAYFLTLVVSKAWLDAPERVYPVVIDPTVTIQPAAGDTTIGEQYPNSNYDGTYLIAGRFAGSPWNTCYRTLVKFDLAGAGLSVDDAINQAYLKLYMWTDPAGQPVDISMYRLTKDWVASQATWNNATSGTSWSGGGAEGDYDTAEHWTTPVSGSQTWATWEATHVTAQWLGGEHTNYGMLLRADNESSAYMRKYFDSNEWYAQQTQRPKLEVTYSIRWYAGNAHDPEYGVIADISTPSSAPYIADGMTCSWVNGLASGLYWVQTGWYYQRDWANALFYDEWMIPGPGGYHRDMFPTSVQQWNTSKNYKIIYNGTEGWQFWIDGLEQNYIMDPSLAPPLGIQAWSEVAGSPQNQLYASFNSVKYVDASGYSYYFNQDKFTATYPYYHSGPNLYTYECSGPQW